ncbi:hypothetical protein [Methylobacterium sp. GC_Met_2]|uniref:hypothetical protein n=1 Tax=Methylobacterium sp. GC_Met_2 TaxID=2937376 RepID=UPI00226B111B|nr:hypothetical protein [Methylobacterium sp. GC_Met_2]
MTKTKLTLIATVLLGGFAFVGPVSAAPMSPSGIQTDHSGITQVRMMHKRMMRRHMMKKRMMHRM